MLRAPPCRNRPPAPPFLDTGGPAVTASTIHAPNTSNAQSTGYPTTRMLKSRDAANRGAARLDPAIQIPTALDVLRERAPAVISDTRAPVSNRRATVGVRTTAAFRGICRPGRAALAGWPDTPELEQHRSPASMSSRHREPTDGRRRPPVSVTPGSGARPRPQSLRCSSAGHTELKPPRAMSSNGSLGCPHRGFFSHPEVVDWQGHPRQGMLADRWHPRRTRVATGLID